MTLLYFLDTEFSESPGQLDLISIGLVCEDGREFYTVLGDGWTYERCNPWVQEHVLPNLGARPRMTRADARERLLAFVGHGTFGPDAGPEFWGYYADYDWVAFCWLFGAMIDLPKGWPMYCRDLKQRADDLGLRLPYSNDTHNALEDARDMRRNWQWLSGTAIKGPSPRGRGEVRAAMEKANQSSHSSDLSQ
jgi:hypothetical protein